MSGVKVNTDKVREIINEMKSLKRENESYRKKKKPKPAKGKGLVADELIRIMDEIDDVWTGLYELTDKTIEFLTQSSESVDEFDRRGARAIE